jgi:acylglycerol lipase
MEGTWVRITLQFASATSGGDGHSMRSANAQPDAVTIGSDISVGAAEVRRLLMSDGVEVHCLVWLPAERPPAAIVVFLHGIASHGAWFGETASWLAARGIGVYAPDRRGSGHSGGRRGHVRRYERALTDVEEIVRVASSEHEGRRVFVAASSWSAKLAVVYAAQRRRLDGLLLLGPGLLPTVNLSVARRVWVLLGHLLAPTSQVAIPLSPELYTAEEDYRRYIRGDPLRLHSATTRFFWETARLDRRRPQATARLQLPVLMLQGDADAMMDVTATRRWVTDVPSADVTYQAYPGAGHTLDFEPEPNRGRYRTDLLRWIVAHSGPQPGGDDSE